MIYLNYELLQSAIRYLEFKVEWIQDGQTSRGLVVMLTDLLRMT